MKISYSEFLVSSHELTYMWRMYEKCKDYLFFPPVFSKSKLQYLTLSHLSLAKWSIPLLLSQTHCVVQQQHFEPFVVKKEKWIRNQSKAKIFSKRIPPLLSFIPINILIKVDFPTNSLFFFFPMHYFKKVFLFFFINQPKQSVTTKAK